MKKTLIGIALFLGGVISYAISGLVPGGSDLLAIIFMAFALIGLIIMIVEFFVPEKKKRICK